MSVRRLAISGLLLAVVAGCIRPGPPPPRGEGPSLVLMIVVDQARHDYLERFRPLFSGGLAWLLDNGVVFEDAHQNHANTSTAPGHAALSTGTEPWRSGIVGNDWFDRATESEVYSAGPSEARSPEYLLTTAFGDWLKAADRRAKVFTASAKDRSAVMLGGQSADAAYWYDRSTGSWHSSSYYRGWERPWLIEFNARGMLDDLFGTAWEPLTGAHAWPAFEVAESDTGAFERGFPHVLGGMTVEPGPAFYGAVYDSPFVDEYLAQLARAMIEGEELGADGVVDFVGLSFSATDAVGHDYGPDSPEVLDVLCRLDVLIGELLDFIDERIGLEHVLVGFSSDHGVMPLPEVRGQSDQPGRRLGAEDLLCIQQAGAALRREIGEGDWLLDGLYLDHDLIAERGLELADVQSRLAALLGGCGAVRKAWTGAEIAAAGSSDPLVQMYVNNYMPERSPDVILQLEPFFLYDRGLGTTHGSVYGYDSHVPLIIVGAQIPPGRVADRVATVDLAPTLAALLGIPAPEELDGRDLGPLLWQRP